MSRKCGVVWDAREEEQGEEVSTQGMCVGHYSRILASSLQVGVGESVV